MTNNEKRAHDLAMLYMEMEIQHEAILPLGNHDEFANNYIHLYNQFINLLDGKI